MKNHHLILIILLAATSLIHQNAEASITSDSTNSRPRDRRYDGTKWNDTIIVNGEQKIVSKKYLRKNYKDIVGSEHYVVLNGQTLTRAKAREIVRKEHRDSVRAHKKVWGTVLGGPSYTPESSIGVAAAALLSFKFNSEDTVSHRSLLPFGFMVSSNGSYMLAGDSEFYLKENRLRILTEYSFRYEPDNYFGIGAKNIDGVVLGKNTTQYNRLEIKINPTVLWEVKPKLFVGGVLDYAYYQLKDINPQMAQDAYFNRFKPKYLTAGIGANVLYDSRDNPTMPYRGVRAEVLSMVYGSFLGSRYNFTYNKIEYRQYQRLFNRRSVLAWSARMDITTGDVPITNLASFGSPTNLRGYLKGHYRDKSMGYAIVEYRHMLGSQHVYDTRRPLWSRLGFVVWAGLGTIGENPTKFNTLKSNYGIGLRYEVQPNSNVRFDLGRGPKGEWLFYMNMIEAF